MSDLGEASAAVAAAREVAPDLPVVVTMSFDTNPVSYTHLTLPTSDLV